MPSPADAEEHLRVIRSLMERATHYRAISAQGALVGGLLALGAGSWMAWRDAKGLACFHCELTVWLIVLAITAIANGVFLWRDERSRGEKLFSTRARWAMRALAPSFTLAGVVTILSLSVGSGELGSHSQPSPEVTLYFLGCIWSGAYAVALLAASHFAPRSLLILGRTFFVATIIALSGWAYLQTLPHPNLPLLFELYMAATFGLFHLVYALLTWPRSGVASADV